MNISDLKLELFRVIDQLPEELLLELKQSVMKLSTSKGESFNHAQKRQFGSMKDLVLFMSPDFNEPLEEFNDYAPE